MVDTEYGTDGAKLGKFIYVHGTNGSGKSTLARQVLAASGGIAKVVALNQNSKARFTVTKNGLVLLGSYHSKCGGVDGINPYAEVLSILEGLRWGTTVNVFAEGMVTPGVDTCCAMASKFKEAVFIHLDTPTETCIANVLTRRAAKNNVTPYDPKNLLRKHVSAANWATRLERKGLTVVRLQYAQAKATLMRSFSLQEPNLDTLLDMKE